MEQIIVPVIEIAPGICIAIPHEVDETPDSRDIIDLRWLFDETQNEED